MDPAAEFFARERQDLGDVLGYTDENSHYQQSMINGADNEHPTPAEASMRSRPARPPPPSSSAAIDSLPSATITEEPENVRRWRKEFRERIEANDKKETEKVDELQRAAVQELCEWRRHYAEQMEKNWSLNRDHDKHLTLEREAAAQRNKTLEPSEAYKAASQCSTWEQVCQLCTFSAPRPVHSGSIAVSTVASTNTVGGNINSTTRSSGATTSSGANSSKDVSRMRSILLHLKQNPLVRGP